MEREALAMLLPAEFIAAHTYAPEKAQLNEPWTIEEGGCIRFWWLLVGL